MRAILIPAFAALLLSAPAGADVNVDLGALDRLVPSAPAKPPPKPAAKPKVQAAPKPTTPAPKQAELPAVTAPPAQSAKLDPGATQRPEPVPTPPVVEESTPPAEPPPQKPVPFAQAFGAIAFTGGGADLTAEAKDVLLAAADRLESDDRLRLEVLAYASIDDPSQARRLSLSRALAARSFLVEHGVRTQRIDLRPLGTPSEGAGDRIDLRLARH